MSDKQKIPQASEPAEIYQIGKIDATSNEINSELKQLLEKAKQESAEGKFFTHDEVKKKVREKFPFIK